MTSDSRRPDGHEPDDAPNGPVHGAPVVYGSPAYPQQRPDYPRTEYPPETGGARPYATSGVYGLSEYGDHDFASAEPDPAGSPESGGSGSGGSEPAGYPPPGAYPPPPAAYPPPPPAYSAPPVPPPMPPFGGTYGRPTASYEDTPPVAQPRTSYDPPAGYARVSVNPQPEAGTAPGSPGAFAAGSPEDARAAVPEIPPIPDFGGSSTPFPGFTPASSSSSSSTSSSSPTPASSPTPSPAAASTPAQTPQPRSAEPDEDAEWPAVVWSDQRRPDAEPADPAIGDASSGAANRGTFGAAPPAQPDESAGGYSAAATGTGPGSEQAGRPPAAARQPAADPAGWPAPFGSPAAGSAGDAPTPGGSTYGPTSGAPSYGPTPSYGSTSDGPVYGPTSGGPVFGPTSGGPVPGSPAHGFAVNPPTSGAPAGPAAGTPAYGPASAVSGYDPPAGGPDFGPVSSGAPAHDPNGPERGGPARPAPHGPDDAFTGAPATNGNQPGGPHGTPPRGTATGRAVAASASVPLASRITPPPGQPLPPTGSAAEPRVYGRPAGTPSGPPANGATPGVYGAPPAPPTAPPQNGTPPGYTQVRIGVRPDGQAAHQPVPPHGGGTYGFARPGELSPPPPPDPAEQDRFNRFTAGAPAAAEPKDDTSAPPAPKNVRLPLAIFGIVGAAALLLVVAFGITWVATRPGAPTFEVGSCVRQSGQQAVKADCTESGAFTVVQKVDQVSQCADPGQPYVVVPAGKGREQVLCLRAAGK